VPMPRPMHRIIGWCFPPLVNGFLREQGVYDLST